MSRVRQRARVGHRICAQRRFGPRRVLRGLVSAPQRGVRRRGSWPWEEPDYPDQVTFGCRLGPVEGQDGPAASLVTGGENKSDHPLFGVKLDREAALEHPRLADFWEVIDWLVVNDPTLHENVYHMDEEE